MTHHPKRHHKYFVAIVPTCASYEGADEVRTEGEESQGSASSTETGEGQTTMTANDEDNHYKSGAASTTNLLLLLKELPTQVGTDEY